MEPEPDGLAQVRDAHNYAWTVLEGILPYSAQVHKRQVLKKRMTMLAIGQIMKMRITGALRR